MADASLATYQDLTEYCQALRHGGARTLEQTDIRAAIHGAYQDVQLTADWQYYDQEYRINLNDNYSTGTVTYDHAGHAQGSYALTISGGTWPSWIARGRIRINDVVYKVDRVSSGDADVIILDSLFNPGADIASATTFLAYQSVYQLPADLVTIEDICVEEGIWATSYMEPSEWLASERFSQTTGRTWGWTLMKDPKEIARWAVFLDPVPDEAEPLGFIYRRKPRTLRWAGTESTARFTGSGSSGATTVTSSTTLPQSMVGSILRICESTTESPTGLIGQNPFIEQHEIYSISSTTVTLKTALGQAFSAGSKCVATDPVDMSDTMTESLKARIEYRMARMYGEGKDAGRILGLAEKEMRLALERDSRVQVSRSAAFIPFKDWMKRIGVVDG